MKFAVNEDDLYTEESRARRDNLYIAIHHFPFHVGSDAGINDGDTYLEFPLGVYKTRKSFMNAFNRKCKSHEAKASEDQANVVYFVRRG